MHLSSELLSGDLSLHASQSLHARHRLDACPRTADPITYTHTVKWIGPYWRRERRSENGRYSVHRPESSSRVRLRSCATTPVRQLQGWRKAASARRCIASRPVAFSSTDSNGPICCAILGSVIRSRRIARPSSLLLPRPVADNCGFVMPFNTVRVRPSSAV